MAKVRFYCDVPIYKYGVPYQMWATTSPQGSPCDGFKRVAFDVDMPPEVLKPYDVVAPCEVAGIIEGEEE